ncbi:hypothetical protein K438DRAFT_1807989 [Mycena galopus ATCC 62051]|nr:hypothetical protein K438DRAFT_1807989 [Mycena galopus ATCC 62051]
MFSFPEPRMEDPTMTKDGKPIIPLSESSKTVEKLLILCYPRFSSYGFRDLDGLDGAYEAAGKYEIHGGQQHIEQVLEEPRFLEKEPHRVFAIACHRGLETVARAAAMQTLKMPRYLRQLEDFHFRCEQMIVTLVKQFTFCDWDDYWCPDDPDDVPGENYYEDVWWTKDDHSAGCGPVFNHDVEQAMPAKWFRDHIEAVADAVALRPDTASASKHMANISGSTMDALSKCPKCPSLAPYSLASAAQSLENKATHFYKHV